MQYSTFSEIPHNTEIDNSPKICQNTQVLESNLNPQQLEAVKHFEGPILVLAGAGSGKTRVLTRRIAYLIVKQQIHPDEILAVTFTNKAAKEMQHRLAQMLGENMRHAWVSTFHSAGVRFLRRHANILGYTNDFVIYDDQDSKNVIKGVMKELDINEKYYPAYDFAKSIDRAKNNNITPEEFLSSEFTAGAKDEVQEMQHKIYERYQQTLRKSNAMDFGDLLMNMVQILQKHPEVRKFYQRKLRFVLVDEFQDTNVIQYLFIKLITEEHKNLLVVGDDDQSIYAFRGATINNILEFEKDYKDTKVIKLEQNYRSTGNILKASHAVIEKNRGRKDKKLWTESEDGNPIITFCDWDEEGEANYVASEILKNISKGYKAGDIAIFYRTNAQSRALEEALISFGIKYKIFGGLRFYDRKEIKDILAYIRLIVNEFDSQAFLRVINTPTRGIGAQTIKNMVILSNQKDISLITAARETAVKNKHVAKFLEIYDALRAGMKEKVLSKTIADIIDTTGYLDALKASKDPTTLSRIENLAELKAISHSMDNFSEDNLEVLKHFIDRTTLSSSADLPEEERGEVSDSSQYVSLMTLHIAKGLEFPIVFLTGLEEGLIPHHRSIIEGDIEEERRLCYVGMTRAMKLLYITRAQRRGLFNSGENFGGFSSYRRVSRFAADIPEECMDANSSNFFANNSYLEFDDSEENEDLEVNEESGEAYLENAFSSFKKFNQKKKIKGKGFKITSADDLE